jgi:hypothetical protein
MYDVCTYNVRTVQNQRAGLYQVRTALHTELVQSYTLLAERHLKTKNSAARYRYRLACFRKRQQGTLNTPPLVVDDDALLPSAADNNTALVSG